MNKVDHLVELLLWQVTEDFAIERGDNSIEIQLGKSRVNLTYSEPHQNWECTDWALDDTESHNLRTMAFCLLAAENILQESEGE